MDKLALKKENVMNMGSLFVFLIILSFTLSTMRTLSKYRRIKGSKEKFDQWSLQKREESDRERREWNERLGYAKRHLTGDDWEDPVGKEMFIYELFYGKVPEFIWYSLYRGLIEKEKQEIIDLLLTKDRKLSGNLEIYQDKILRIRNPVRVSYLLLGEFPLMAIGELFPINLEGFAKEHNFPKGVVDFSAEGFYPKKAE